MKMLKGLTIKAINKGLRKKEFTALELCQAYLEKISQKDKSIKAFLTISEELALSQAREIDEMILTERRLPILAGVPCAIKDNILVKDIKCTAGSKILGNYIAPYDATVIKKLREQKALILGKTNLDEFAMGSSTENSAFFPTKNPIDLKRVPGGSSGGSAAAVAADESVFALGSDTGGSIRLPASFCGVVGLKPTYGAVSRYGLIALASSLDQIGPITKTVEDCKIVFETIRGYDQLDSTSINHKSQIKNYKQIRNQKLEIRNLIVGVPKEYFVKGIDPEVEKLIKKAIKKYQEMGVRIEEVNLPHTEYALPAYYIINPSEASANLARYDGIKYGYSVARAKGKRKMKAGLKDQTSVAKKVGDLMEVYLRSREEGFGQEVRRRIMLGTYALSAGYYEAYYLRAQKVRTLIREDFEKVFEKVEAIFSPVSANPAFKLGEKSDDPLKMYLSDIYTVSVNLAGLPAVSIPIGKVNPYQSSQRKRYHHPQERTSPDQNSVSGAKSALPSERAITKDLAEIGGGLPVGLQIIGRPFEEEKILEIAQAIEED